MRWALSLLVAAGLCVAVSPQPGGGPAPVAAQPAKPDAPKAAVRLVPGPWDAVLAALADAEQVWGWQQGMQLAGMPYDDDLPYTLYVWVRGGQTADLQATSLALNDVSLAVPIIRPPAVQAGGVTLAKVDLRKYAPRVKDLALWQRLREELQFDPAFATLITRDALQFYGAVIVNPEVPVVARLADGKTLATSMDHLGTDIVLARANGVHLPPGSMERLQTLLYTSAPIVTHSYLMARICTTLKDAKDAAGKDVVDSAVFATVMGGLYYDFANLRDDLDAQLAELGIGDPVKKVTFEDAFEEDRSDMRAIKAVSDVTDQLREVDLLPANKKAGRPDKSTRIVVLTRDLKVSSIDLGKNPFFNLRRGIKADGFEVIWTGQNGTHRYGAYNGQRKRVDSVPDDIAHDSTIKAPHRGRLEASHSCKSCHEAEGSGGWRAFDNDAAKFLKRANVFGGDPDADDRLAGLYFGEMEDVFVPARAKFNRVVLEATGPMGDGKDGFASAAKLGSARVVDVVRGYRLDRLGPREALWELGIDCEGDKAQALFDKLLPPVPGLVIEANGVRMDEDPTIANLKDGIRVTRHAWDLVYSAAALRAQAGLAELRKAAEQK